MFKRQDRRRIVQEYLNASGANAFVPAEFLDWLREHPDHECHGLFFGKSDADAAQSYREDMVRKWVSGLRITVLQSAPQTTQVNGVEIREYKLPMMLSPMSGRKQGGGYENTDPDDPAHIAEIAQQGAYALAAWVERYEGAANMLGVDVSACKTIVGALEAKVVAPE